MSILNSTHSLGTLMGVDVRAHATLPWFLGLGALALLIFSGPSAMLAGLFMVLALVLSVTLHELGHIGAASLFGNRTEGITLTPIGGIATLEREAATREEIVVALAGPAVNLALAGLAAIPLAFLGASVVAEWFLRINLILALFNLLPAFPMDGGRVLRGVLWKKRGYLEASRLAARTGQFFGLAFVLGSLFMGPMLFAVGLFVLWQATQELARLHVLRCTQELQAQGLDLSSLAALLFGGQAPAPSAPPTDPMRSRDAHDPRRAQRPQGAATWRSDTTWRTPERRPAAFSKVEFVIGPDGRARPIDRSPW